MIHLELRIMFYPAEKLPAETGLYEIIVRNYSRYREIEYRLFAHFEAAEKRWYLPHTLLSPETRNKPVKGTVLAWKTCPYRVQPA